MLALAFVAFGLALGVDSDGARRVAIQRTPTTLEVRDDARGRREVLGLAPGCLLHGLSRGGIVLLLCRDSYQTIDLRTGARSTYAAPVGELPDEQVDYVAAGRFWLARKTSDYHYEDLDYVQVLTGEVRRGDGPRIYGDVDSPGLVKPLCGPVRRFGYAQPHGGAGWQPATSDGRVAVVEDSIVWRCGDRRPLPDIRTGAHRVTAGGGWATWWGHAIRLRDRRRFRLPPGDVVHTRRAVYVLRAGHLRRARL